MTFVDSAEDFVSFLERTGLSRPSLSRAVEALDEVDFEVKWRVAAILAGFTDTGTEEGDTVSFDRSMVVKGFKDAERRARLLDDDDEPQLDFAIQVFRNVEPSLVAVFISECSWSWKERGRICGSSMSENAEIDDLADVVPNLHWLLSDNERDPSMTRDDARFFFEGAKGPYFDALAVCFLADDVWSPNENWQI